MISSKQQSLLGILFLIITALHVVAIGFTLNMIIPIFSDLFNSELSRSSEERTGALIFFLTMVSIFLIALALIVPSSAATIGAFTKAKWARSWMIIAAFVAMLNLPLGTIAGALALRILLKSNQKA
jgi:hypothetical protein